MNKSALPVLIPFLLLSSGAFAEEKMKAGLWEMTIQSDMLKNMPKIPPEQLRQMKEMGIAMPQMQDGGMVTRICITREMAERDQAPEMNYKEAGCQPKNYQRAGGSYSVDIVCDGPDMKGRGTARGKFSGSDSFTSTYDFKGTMQGQPLNQHQESSGKWLGADCGSVAPPDTGGQPRRK